MFTQTVVISNQEHEGIRAQSTALALPLSPLPYIHPSFHPSIYPPLALTPPPFPLILHPQHRAQTSGEIMSACQPLCSDRLEQSFLLLLFFYLPCTRESWHDWHSSQVLIVVLCADFVGESLLTFSHSGKALLTARMMKVQQAVNASLSVNAGILLSPKLLLLGDVVYCWVIVENSLVLPHLNTKEISLKDSVPLGMQRKQSIYFNLIDLAVT